MPQLKQIFERNSKYGYVALSVAAGLTVVACKYGLHSGFTTAAGGLMGAGAGAGLGYAAFHLLKESRVPLKEYIVCGVLPGMAYGMVGGFLV